MKRVESYETSVRLAPDVAIKLKKYAEEKQWSISHTLRECFLEVFAKDQVEKEMA